MAKGSFDFVICRGSFGRGRQAVFYSSSCGMSGLQNSPSDEGKGDDMKTILILPILGFLLWATAQANENDQPSTETSPGWVKYAKNPVLGGDLGTCFDISVLKEGDTYRMCFSWRPKKSIALVESKDGIQWSKPVIVIGPNAKTDWENDLNRPVVIKNGDRYQMWYTGQARGKPWIGYATSKDGKWWERESDTP